VTLRDERLNLWGAGVQWSYVSSTHTEVEEQVTNTSNERERWRGSKGLGQILREQNRELGGGYRNPRSLLGRGEERPEEGWRGLQCRAASGRWVRACHGAWGERVDSSGEDEGWMAGSGGRHRCRRSFVEASGGGTPGGGEAFMGPEGRGFR